MADSDQSSIINGTFTLGRHVRMKICMQTISDVRTISGWVDYTMNKIN